uniref:Pyridoxal kinase n=1 Tax=Clytia hemisphaerica TaxID=252671 RepID=A0A7M5XLZ3_9CNID
MGDDGKFYVPQELLPIYRDEVVPFADVLTPNQFEAELLTGMKIKNEEDAFQAMKALHVKGPETVVLTSTHFENKPNLVLMASNKNDLKQYIKLQIPRLDAVFTGTGDLFASMLLAWSHNHPNDLKVGHS